MFRPEPRIPFVPVLREQVLSLVASINLPHVSVPGRAAQPALGHVCVVRNGNGSVSVYVNFHLTLSGENMVYVNDRHEIAPAEAAAVRQDAAQLLESMGFMLDDLRFEALGAEAQEELIRRTPMFSPPANRAAAAPAAPTGPGAALGRLLSSF